MNSTRLGQVLGPVGLVLLLAGIPTLMFSQDTWLGHLNNFFGLAFITLYISTNFKRLTQAATGKGAFFFITSAVTTLLLVAGLVAVNVLAVKRPKTWDLTKNQIFTLSSDTEKTLASLTEPVKVSLFFQTGERGQEAYDDLLQRYGRHTDKLTVQKVDPLKQPAEAKRLHISEGGARVVVEYKGVEQKVSAPTEEELTNALVKVTHATEKKAYFLTGHNESGITAREAPGLTALVARMATEGLVATPLELAHAKEVPRDASFVVVAGPDKALTGLEVELLRRYLAEGGRALIALEPLSDSGLADLLREYGVQVDPGLVVDLSSQRPGASQDLAFMPVSAGYGEHELTARFKTLTMYPTAASLTLAAPGAGTGALTAAQPLVFTSENSWVETQPNLPPVQVDANEKRGPLTLAAVATRDVTKDKNLEKEGRRNDQARLVVFGDRDFMTNGMLPTLGNEDLALNVMNYLASQSERIVIRPRTRDASRVYLTAGQLAGIRFFATELPIALLAFGLAVYTLRRSR